MIDLLVRDVRVRDQETGEPSAVDLHVDGGRLVGARRSMGRRQPDATTVGDIGE